MRRARLYIQMIPILSLVLTANLAQGQGWMDRIKQKAKEKVQQREDAATDSVTDAVLNHTENAVRCVIGNLACIRKAEAAGQPVAVVNAQGQPVSTADSAKAIASVTGSVATPAAATSAATAAGAAPGSGTVDVNHDFTPGTRVIWATDFASDPIGDFPRRLTLKQGNFETASWKGQHLLRTTSGGDVIVPLPEVLPKQFTLEFDYTGGTGWSTTEKFSDAESIGSVYFSTAGDAGIDGGDDGAKSSSSVGDLGGQQIHCQVMVDGNYVKVYINGKRVAQVPNANLGRSNKIVFTLVASEDMPAFLGNIRVAAGGKNMYEALSTEGRFTTHDILFATGSAALDPRSTSALTEIGQMLQQHPDLRVEIDGHTDNVGSAAANLTLSDQRAASVKQYLVSNFQLGASRLTSRGFGASKSVAPNDTPDGRQQNRRVELVRQ